MMRHNRNVWAFRMNYFLGEPPPLPFPPSPGLASLGATMSEALFHHRP
jgi:hypothetical protein